MSEETVHTWQSLNLPPTAWVDIQPNPDTGGMSVHVLSHEPPDSPPPPPQVGGATWVQGDTRVDVYWQWDGSILAVTDVDIHLLADAE